MIILRQKDYSTDLVVLGPEIKPVNKHAKQGADESKLRHSLRKAKVLTKKALRTTSGKIVAGSLATLGALSVPVVKKAKDKKTQPK